MSASAPMVTYVTSSATAPIGASTSAPMMYAPAPAVFNIPPEVFARIAAGQPMSQEEITALLSGVASPVVVATDAAKAVSAVSSKKKSMKVSKKKAKGCC
mmetsp:Transcript_51605/g.136323  ORF Transcript_51605/g.136323 Transcript_51605/m.136323 type:complete len:100 (-) Transcript_51605:68-367(-)